MLGRFHYFRGHNGGDVNRKVTPRYIFKEASSNLKRLLDPGIGRFAIYSYTRVQDQFSEVEKDLCDKLLKNKAFNIITQRTIYRVIDYFWMSNAYFALGPNMHWTSNYGTGIVFIGNMLSWLSFHNFVWWSLNAHISIISPNIWDLFSKSNSSIYYLEDCSIIFKENQTVFVNINKKPRYPF